MADTEQPDLQRDELIMQQQRKIEQEISDTIPLVGDGLSLTALNLEYNDDPVYASKVRNLSEKYTLIRKTRPDGNCFFRGFAYAYLEYLTKNKEDYEKFRILAQESMDRLVKLGFPEFTVQDFHDTFMEVLNRVNPMEKTVPENLIELHDLFNKQGYSDYVVVYLRLVASGQLQEGAEFYQHFIEGNFTIEEFRHQEVEPMYKESDHIHIIAICAALNVGVRIEYMDRGDGDHVKAHDFPDGVKPHVYLLYRPGHYDILYPK